MLQKRLPTLARITARAVNGRTRQKADNTLKAQRNACVLSTNKFIALNTPQRPLCHCQSILDSSLEKELGKGPPLQEVFLEPGLRRQERVTQSPICLQVESMVVTRTRSEFTEHHAIRR